MNSIKAEYLPHYTYDDYIKWEGKWELINGIPYAMTPGPNINHQEISYHIADQLRILFDKCEKYKPSLPIDYKIDEDTVLQPDNLVIPRNASGNFLDETPVIVFEILSPSTAVKDKNVKFNIYEAQGVQYYIIVDPVKELVEIFALINNKYSKAAEMKNDIFTFKLDECDLDFEFEKVW